MSINLKVESNDAIHNLRGLPGNNALWYERQRDQWRELCSSKRNFIVQCAIQREAELVNSGQRIDGTSQPTWNARIAVCLSSKRTSTLGDMPLELLNLKMDGTKGEC